MILGHSHISINCTDIEAGSEQLAKFGYSPKETIVDLENHIRKAKLLKHYEIRHNIQLLTAKGAMSIELINHGIVTGTQTSMLIPIFKGISVLPEWKQFDLKNLPICKAEIKRICTMINDELRLFYDPILQIKFLWAPAYKDPVGLFACLVPTNQINNTNEILKQLRFSQDLNGIWSLLTPITSLEARLITAIERSSSIWSKEDKLDNRGSTCMALMSRTSDINSLPKALQKSATSFIIRINKVERAITLAKITDGPFLEIIET